MMPESTRPVRETASDATFTIDEEIPVATSPEPTETSKKKQDASAAATAPA
jgi:hypothetical protein